MHKAPQALKQSTYWELLKHPNWQRKRLEVLNRERFTCESCGATDETLHVHHSYYEKGKKPWEYPDRSLHSVCEECHDYVQANMSSFHQQIGRLTLAEQEIMFGVAIGLEMLSDGSVQHAVFSGLVAMGVAMPFGTNAGFVRDVAGEDTLVTGDEIVAALARFYGASA